MWADIIVSLLHSLSSHIPWLNMGFLHNLVTTADIKSHAYSQILLLLVFNANSQHCCLNNVANIMLFHLCSYLFHIHVYFFLETQYFFPFFHFLLQFILPLGHKLPDFLSCIFLPPLVPSSLNVIFLPQFLPPYR